MKKFLQLFFISFFISCNSDDVLSTTDSTIYFPPIHSSEWETSSSVSLGWNSTNINPLYSFLENTDTRAFLVLKNGKIVLEKYWGKDLTQTAPFNQNSVWYWASAGKTITSVLIGIAQQNQLLSINEKTSKYLGLNWTSLNLPKENLITLKNQLSMTTGLDDGVSDENCTDAHCLIYMADAGTRWAYHNAPYTLLDLVLEKASGKSLNTYTQEQLANKIGMSGNWYKMDYNNIYFSTARDMARFGLLVSNKGKWENLSILNSNYCQEMLQTSQNLNLSYGYLWWLNGKTSFRVPNSQMVFSGSLCPNAPKDMVSALGKNGQILDIIPSSNIIVIRLGDNPDNSLVPFVYHDKIWQYLQSIIRF